MIDEFEKIWLRDREAYQPWLADPNSDDVTKWKYFLSKNANANFGKNVYVALAAKIFTDYLNVGDFTFLAAHCFLRGHIVLGSNVSVNPTVVMAGKVQIGNAVRIAAGCQFLGFNHNYERVDVPIYQQGTVSKGIIVEDDVWFGSNCLVLDGVSIAKGCVVAAGSVVNKDVIEPFSIVAGVPAKIVSKRGS